MSRLIKPGFVKIIDIRSDYKEFVGEDFYKELLTKTIYVKQFDKEGDFIKLNGFVLNEDKVEETLKVNGGYLNMPDLPVKVKRVYPKSISSKLINSLFNNYEGRIKELRNTIECRQKVYERDLREYKEGYRFYKGLLGKLGQREAPTDFYDEVTLW